MHLGGHCYNRVELLTSKGAEKSTVASAADCEVEADSLTAGHERKHNACRAESEVVLVDIPISAEYCCRFDPCLPSWTRHNPSYAHYRQPSCMSERIQTVAPLIDIY